MILIALPDGADLDLLSSARCMTLLVPGARLVHPKRLAQNAWDMARRSPWFSSIHVRAIDWNLVKIVHLLEITRLPHNPELTEILTRFDGEIISHSRQSASLPFQVQEPMAYSQSLTAHFTLQLFKRGEKISEDDAELLLMGIIERTGAFLSSHVTETDIEALNRLRNFAIPIRRVSNQVVLGFREGQHGLLKDLLRNVKDSEIHNRPVMLTVVRSLGNVQELLPVMDALWSREEPYLLIAGVCYIGRTYVWARGKMPQEEIFRCFSGYRPIANHRWTVFSMNENEVDQVLNKLLLDLQAGLRPDVTAAEIMMTSPKCVDLRLSVAETLDTMLRFNQMWFVVTKEGEFAGMIRRLDLDRAVQMDIWDSPIGQFISANYPSITVDTPVRVARQLMILHNLDQLPVVDQGRPVGVITTREILRGLPDPIPIPKRFIPLVQTPDLPDCEKMTGLVKRVVSIPVFHILKRIGEIARKNSVQAYLVGGFVRDLLLERLNLDIDIVIIGDALPFAALASQELNAEIRIFDLFHTAQLTKDGIKIDFSSARLEHYSASGALPEVELSGLFNDLSRRDFTMNAMALDLSPDRYLRLVDFFGGYRDILNHRLRILHSFSFIEDPTRIFRAIRFASRFRFGLTEDTASAFHLAVDRRVVEKLSPKRMHAEISRCFREEFPGRVMDQLFRLRLLRAFHQDLTEAKILPPRFKMIPGIVRRFGVIGEPIDSETVHWIGLLMHVSPIEVDGFLKQIGHSSLKRRKIVESIAAMISTPPKLVRLKPDDNVGLSELLSGLSPEGLVALVTFSLDKIGVGRVFDYLARLRNIRSGISGKDLLGLGIPSGPHIGLILKETLREKIRGGLKNRKDELAYAGKLYQDLCLQKFK